MPQPGSQTMQPSSPPDYAAFVLDAFGAADYMLDLRTDSLHPSPRLNSLYGYPAGYPLTGDDCRAAYHPEDRGALESIVAEAAASGEPRFQREFRIILPDGSLRWVLSRGEVLFDDAGNPVLIRGAAIDITERRHTEAALRDSEAHLADVFEQAQVGISEIAADGRFLRVNATLCHILGRTRAELLAATIADVTLAEDLPQSLAAVGRLFATGVPLSLDKRYVRPDGSVVWANSALALVTNGTPSPIILAVTVDMTERRKAEAARRESAVLRRLAAAQEEERLRIARDLHDQLGQQITGLLLGLKQLALAAQETHLAPMLTPLQAITLDLARESHRLAVNLRPTALEDFGLVPALERQVADWSAQSGIPAAFQSHGLSQHRLPRSVEVGLFRVVQEALTNVRKHARATRVGVVIERTGDQIVVVVEDDGRGFEVDEIAPVEERPQLGLLGMRERVAQFGGALEIETAPGRGTTVFVRIPLDPDEIVFSPS